MELRAELLCLPKCGAACDALKNVVAAIVQDAADGAYGGRPQGPATMTRLQADLMQLYCDRAASGDITFVVADGQHQRAHRRALNTPCV